MGHRVSGSDALLLSNPRQGLPGSADVMALAGLGRGRPNRETVLFLSLFCVPNVGKGLPGAAHKLVSKP